MSTNAFCFTKEYDDEVTIDPFHFDAVAPEVLHASPFDLVNWTKVYRPSFNPHNRRNSSSSLGRVSAFGPFTGIKLETLS